MPTQLPASAITNQIQPCSEPEAIPARNAPILHPKPSRAPIPIAHRQWRHRQAARRRPSLPPQPAAKRRQKAGTKHHAEIHQAADIGKHRMFKRALRPGPLPEGEILDRQAERRGDLRPPQGKTEGDAPRMSRQREDQPAQAGDHRRAGKQPARHRLPAATADHIEAPANRRDQQQVQRCPRTIRGTAANRHLPERAPAKRRRQQEGAEKRAENEEGKRHHHPAGPAAEAEQHAGTAAIGKLHADPEDEGTHEKRGRNRRERSAGIQPQRACRDEDKRTKPDQQEMRGKPHCLAVDDPAPPGRGEPVLKPDEHRAKRRAKREQADAAHTRVERHEPGQPQPGKAEKQHHRPFGAGRS